MTPLGNTGFCSPLGFLSGKDHIQAPYDTTLQYSNAAVTQLWLFLLLLSYCLSPQCPKKMSALQMYMLISPHE